MRTTKSVLIGSGLAGGSLAAYLGRRGYDVDLYECGGHATRECVAVRQGY